MKQQPLINTQKIPKRRKRVLVISEHLQYHFYRWMLFSLILCNHAFANSFTSVGNGNWNDGATWGNASPGVAGIDFPSSASDEVNVIGHIITLQQAEIVGTLTINSFGIVEVNAHTLSIQSSLDVDGKIAGTGYLKFSGANNSWNGAGVIEVPVDVFGATILEPGAEIDLTAGNLSIASGITFSNRGTLRVSLDVVGLSSTATFDNQDGATLCIGGTFLSTGILEADGNGNTIRYNGTNQTIKIPASNTFDNLVVEGSGSSTISCNPVIQGNLSILGTADLEIDSNSTIQLNGDMVLASTASNPFIMNGSSLEMAGTTLQKIAGDFELKNLTVNNGAGVEIDTGAVEISGTLTVSAGNLETNGLLTLVSNSQGTARVAEVTGSISGEVTVQRYVPSNTTGWRNICAPVDGMTLEDIQDNILLTGFPGSDYPSFPFINVVAYDETVAGNNNNGYYYPSNVTDSMKTGQGFWVYFTPTTLDWKGELHAGSVALPVSYTNTMNVNQDGWNFVGNPFASAIDWSEISLTNVDDQYWVFDPEAGNYAIWSEVTGTGTLGANGNIASGQAFMVHANGANPSAVIPQAAKVSSVDANFKSSSTPAAPVAVFQITSNQSSFFDETVLRFDSEATDNYETPYDVYKIFSSSTGAPGIATQSNDDVDLAINSMGALLDDRVIPLHIKSDVDADLTITALSMEEFSNYNCIMLEDQLTNTWIDMKTTGSYTFFFDQGSADDRLFLHLTAPVQAHMSEESCAGQANGFAVAEGRGQAPFNYLWQDLQGNVMQVNFAVNGADTLQGLSNGTYVVMAQSSNAFCHTSYDTVVLVSPPALAVNANITDVTCYGDLNGAIDLSVAGGQGDIDVNWNNGDAGVELEQLSGGTYVATVSDSGGCIQTHTFVVEEPDPIIAGFTPSEDVLQLQQGALVQFTNNSIGATTYHWDFGEGSSSMALNPQFEYTHPGVYTVVLTAQNNPCTDQSTHVILVEGESDPDGSVTGIEEENALDWSYNIQNDMLVINWNNDQQLNTVSVYNAVGQQMAQKQVNDLPTLTFSLNGLSKGIYYLTLHHGTQQTTQAIVVP